MRLLPLLFAVAVAITISGCAISKLSKAGAQVEANPLRNVSQCMHLGVVTGSSGTNAFAGADKLVAGAIASLRNKAAKKGATDVIPGQAAMTTNDYGNPVAATLIGNAYDCNRAPRYGVPAAVATPPPAPKPTGPLTGTERGKCYGNDTCNKGLTCASGLCVKLP